MREFKSFLAWCSRNKTIHYQTGERFDELFRFKRINPKPKVKYDPDLLKLVFKALQPTDEDTKKIAQTKDKLRCYALLALQCGYYQVDLATLRTSMVQQRKNGLYIVRSRQKTNHQSDLVTEVWLWPETVAAMEQHKAPANPHDLWFLTDAKTPVRRLDFPASSPAVRRRAISTLERFSIRTPVARQ